MIINKIIIKNFGPHKNIVVDMSKSDTLAIVGHNGAGKTFLIESIPACFYGAWASRGNLAEGITQNFVGDAYLSVSFEIGDHSYIAERKIKKSPKSVSQDALLSKDGKCIAGPKVSDFDSAIENLIGNKRIFFASAFSSQKGYGDIVDCLPNERKKILSEILDLNYLQEKADGFSDMVRDSVMKNGSNISSLAYLEESKNDLDVSDLPLLEEQLVPLKKELESSKEERQRLLSELSELTKELAELETIFNSNQEFKNRHVRLNDRRSSLKFEIQSHDHILSKIQELELKHAEREKVILNNQEISKKNSDIQKKIDDYRLKLAQYERDRARFESLKKQADILESGDFSYDPCQSCSLLSSSKMAKDQMLSIKLPTQDKVMEWTKTVSLKTDPLKKLPEDHSDALHKFRGADRKMVMFKQELDSIEAEMKMLEKPLSNPISKEQIIKLSDNLDQIKLDIKRKDVEIEMFFQTISKKEKQIQSAIHSSENNLKIESQIVQIKKDIQYTELKEKLYAYLKNAFGRNGIQALLIDSAIPELQTISDTLVQVATDGRMTIDFSTQKELKSGNVSESLEILCTDKEGTRDISQFSGGEQRILRSVIRLTLAIFQSSKSKIKLGTLIVDEVFDSLDAENSENLLNVLSKGKDHFEKLIFVSHNEELLRDFPNKLILKNNGTIR